MAEPSVNVKFVSQKINKIRWRPASEQVLKHSNVFVTGSWDNEENKVCVWCLTNSSQEMPASNECMIPENEPTLICETAHVGDVTDLTYLNQDLIIASSSVGTVTVYKQQKSHQTLGVLQRWPMVHHNHGDQPAPCTGIASQGEDIVTVGEDGRINALNIQNNYPVRTIDNADSCTLNAVTFLKQFEVITVNSGGQLKVWDLRLPADEPSRTFLLTGDRVPLHCIDKHPNQPHIVATGGQDGMLCIWDMRQDKFPITLLEAHSSDMWEVKFHPSSPDNLFSCSQDGSLWHWDGTTVGSLSLGAPGSSASLAKTLHLPANAGSLVNITSPWLASDASKHRIEITNILPQDNVMPVNTLDVQGNTLLCGTDGEAIFSICNLTIR